MIISVYGLGYIGLPTSAILASKGINVIGVDTNQNTVDIINNGEIHIIEPDLDILVRESVQNGLLKASIEPHKADVFIIAVPTPLDSKKEPDLSFIKSAVETISSVLEKGNLVILESTTPVGTTEKMINWMRLERPELSFPEINKNDSKFDISIAHCPERVLPGKVVNEIVENDRIIGGVTPYCADKAIEIYKIFVDGQCVKTDCRTAELSKLVENSFRDVNIAFANELSIICDKLNINVWNMIDLANRHPRVNILQPGPGVGGHCIAVDPWFIINSASEESKLIKTARVINDRKPDFVLDKVNLAISATNRQTSDLKIACLGITFKPDIDDLRESPSLKIAQKINSLMFKKLLVVEPNISFLPKGFKSGASLVTLVEAINSADIIVLLVDHFQFKSIDLRDLKGKQIVDTRGIWPI